jgi:glycerol-3-phosphate dehydrogenase
VTGGAIHADRIDVQTERETISASVVVNAAGLYADRVSAMLGGEAFTIYPARGEYAELSPSKAKLGETASSISRAAQAGPQPRRAPGPVGRRRHPDRADHSLPGGRADYESDRLPLEAFVEPTSRLLPGITLEDLRLGGSGIRAKLCPPEQSFVDFMIRPDARVPNLIHAAGIDFAGADLLFVSIGRLAAQLVLERL